MKDALFDLLWGRCEMYAFVVNHFGGPRGVSQSITDKHHIWGGKSRLDVPSNLIELKRPSHDFCHTYPVIGKVACIYVVSQREDFRWDEIDRAAGLSVRGWVESKLDSMLNGRRHFLIYAKFAERILDHASKRNVSRSAKRDDNWRGRGTSRCSDQSSD